MKLVFLGRLADVAGAGEMRLALPARLPLAEVLTLLPAVLAGAVTGANIRLALNGALLPPGSSVTVGEGDELAFLPPVSGG